MRTVSPGECNFSVLERNQAMVGNGHSMGVAAEIPENIFRAAEGPFAVDDPVVAEESGDEGMKSLRVRKMLQFAMEADFPFGESVLEGIFDLPSKDLSEDLLRQKEPATRICRHPVLTVERQSAGGNDAVHVWMMLHGLRPGMEHAEEADFGAESLGIAGNFDQCFRTEAQEHCVDELLVLQCELGQGPGHSENDVSIGDGKKFFLPRLNPADSGVGLTLRTSPMPARVVGVAGIAATGAFIDMPAESSRAAAFDGSENLQMLRGDPRTTVFNEFLKQTLLQDSTGS